MSLASRVGYVDYAAHRSRTRTSCSCSDATQETASLIVRDGDHGLYVDQVESRYVLRIGSWVGRRVPLEGTATGAAFADRDRVPPGARRRRAGRDRDRLRAGRRPATDAAISILAPGWRLREFGEERARQIVEAIARKLALSVPR